MCTEIIIATIMRPEGESGIQTHIQQFARYLRSQALRFVIVTPYSSPKPLVYPTFAVRKLLTPTNSAASVWWYRHWHQTFLKQALARRLADGFPRVIYAQCALSALAAISARVNSSQRVVIAIHFNVSEAIEWAEKRSIAPEGRLYRSIQEQELEALRSVDGIVCVSDFMNRELHQRQIFGTNSIPRVVIPNFIADSGEPVVPLRAFN